MNTGSHTAITIPPADLGATLLVETARELKEEVARRQTRGFTGVGGGFGLLLFVGYMFVQDYTEKQDTRHAEIVQKLDDAAKERKVASDERAVAARERTKLKQVQNSQQLKINDLYLRDDHNSAQPEAPPWADVITGPSPVRRR